MGYFPAPCTRTPRGYFCYFHTHKVLTEL